MNITDKNMEKYINAFQTHFNGESKQPFHKIRQNALETANQLGFPSTKQEEWRFTNPAPIAKGEFKLATNESLEKVTAKDIEPFLIKEWSGSLLVFVDGFFSKSLSKIKDNSQIEISTLQQFLQNDNEISSKISSVALYKKDVFVALNTAFTIDGSVIRIPANSAPEDGVHIMHLSASADTICNNRNLIFVEKNSQATVIESFHSLKNDKAFVNTVTEIVVNENARLNHFKFQDESENHFHVGSTAIVQQANSHFTSLAFDFGGKLVRNNVSTLLEGEGITSILNGLYVGENTQHIDNHTFIDHAKPHCESHELYRGILKDKARGVFSGKIMVRQDAQKTDAKQSNNCLLLSDDAQIDAKPQLEIYADDVKCTHGATIGQLDEQAVGYLRSRGIPKKKAVEMLTYAFAEEIIIRIENEPFRQKVENRLLESLSK